MRYTRSTPPRFTSCKTSDTRGVLQMSHLANKQTKYPTRKRLVVARLGIASARQRPPGPPVRCCSMRASCAIPSPAAPGGHCIALKSSRMRAARKPALGKRPVC